MLSLEDERWSKLNGSYRTPFDLRPLLRKLEMGSDEKSVWNELWNELHHQGDVGEASFAAVPHLVRIQRAKRSVDWNTFALVAVVEFARANGKNPDLPQWLAEEYFQAIQDLAEIGAGEVMRCSDPDAVRSILGVIALAKGLRAHGEVLVDFSEEEMRQIASGKWNPFT